MDNLKQEILLFCSKVCKKCCLLIIGAKNMYLKEFKVWLIIEALGVLENETCYKTGRVSTCDFMVVKGCAACLEAKVILGPDLSQGRTCLSAGLVSGAGLVQKLWGRRCPKASGQEVSHGRKCPKV
jgi:hypothetical protein